MEASQAFAKQSTAAIETAGPAGVHPFSAECHDFCLSEDELRGEVLRGLAGRPKTLPCKLFYDARGSALFDRITRLPEYYLTRTEVWILSQHRAEIAAALGEDCVLVEFGAGASEKTRILLDSLGSIACYVPVDISRDYLLESAGRLRVEYPHIPVVPLVADFMRPILLPRMPAIVGATTAFFPGSTIGNLDPRQAGEFLRRTRWMVGDEGGLLLGVDLKKDPAVIEKAYNDSAGVTAAFNKNALLVSNALLDAEFDAELFEHRAVYDQAAGQIEMRLVSKKRQRVRAGSEFLELEKDEYIVTEHSRKFDLDEVRNMAQEAGFAVERVWCDPAKFFSVQYLRAARHWGSH